MTQNLEQTALEGLTLARAGRVKEAEERYRILVAESPLPTARILLASLLPPIYQSMDDLHTWRRRLEDGLRHLVEEGVRQDITRGLAVPEFLAQYHGVNDRPIQEMRAKLYAAPQEEDWGKKRPRSADGRIRVGLISKYFREHTIGRLSRGLVDKLSRDDFHVTVLCIAPANDALGEFFRTRADVYHTIPERIDVLPDIRRLIAGLNLDIIYYTDLGMEPVTYTLAMSRLAPVQCVTWGHPVTAGIPTVDYFISAEGLEPEESQDQYTERLVKLKDLAVSYPRPALNAPPAGRMRFGLPLDAHIYGCPQSLYKMHPEFDAVLAGILHADPRAVLVMLAGQYKDWDMWFMQRLARSAGTAISRVRFAPRQDNQGFLQLNAACDVLLDPIHFGGGNTTYEALSLGVPVVTLPSNMLRGRLAYKMYLSMGVTDCVAKNASDYVQLAVRLGTDRDFRQAVREKIMAAGHVLFENDAGIHQLADFWKSIVT
jgi:protein O-GlcNAc transferase